MFVVVADLVVKEAWQTQQPHRCCAVLCYAVLCCAVLCCAVLCCAVLCCAVLWLLPMHLCLSIQAHSDEVKEEDEVVVDFAVLSRIDAMDASTQCLELDQSNLIAVPLAILRLTELRVST